MIGRIVGLDPGERRIGVAVSDPTGTIASPDRYIDTTAESVGDVLRELCSGKAGRPDCGWIADQSRWF